MTNRAVADRGRNEMEQHTTDYQGYTIKIRHLSNGYWSAALNNSDGSAKASKNAFHTHTDAMEWAMWRVDGLRSLGIE